ncbi:hypothetical protein SNEBB_002606 [Seison nebaliae]|nr:hypothetical protein SNEBB_002606 [Seison nebaliae]
MGKGNNHKVPTKIPKQKKLIVSSSSYYNDLFNYTEPITPFLNITTSIMMTQKPQFKEVSTSSLDVSSTSKKKDSITFTPISQFPIIECLNCSRHHHDNFSNSTTQEHRQNTTINNLLLFNDFPDTTTLYDQYDNYGKFLTNSPIREPEENLLPNFYEANLHKPNNISPTPRRQFQFTRNPTNLSVFTFPFSYAIQRENIEGKRSTISQFNSHRFNEYSSSKRVNGFASTTAEYEVNLNDYNKFKEKFKEKGKFVDETFPHQSTTTTTYDFPIETDDKLPIFHNVKNEPDNWPIKPSITTLNKSSEMNNNFFNFNTTTKTTTTEISPNSRNLFDFLADDRIRMTDSAWLGIYIAGATAFSTLMIIFLIVLGYSHLRRRSHGTYNFLRTFPGELERKSSRFLKQKFRRRFNSNRMVSTETDVSERTSYDVDARPYLLQTSTSSLSQSAKKQRGKSNDEIPSKILKDIPQKPKKRNGKKTKKIESQLQSGTISNCMESNYYTEDNPSIHLSMPQHLHRPTIIPHPSLMPLQYNFPHNQSQNHKLMNGNFIQRFPTSNIHTHQQIIQMNSIPGNIINQLPFHPTSTQNNNQQNYPQHIQMNDYRNNSSNTSSSSSSSTSGLSDDLQNSLSTTDESIVVVQKKQNMFSPSNISRC